MSKRERTNRQYVKGTERQQQRSYSPAVKTRGKTTIYLAGFGGRDESGRSHAHDFDGQVRASFGRIRKTLETAGATLDDIVTMTIFITDMKHGDRFVEIRKEFFRGGYPCSAMIGIKELAHPEMMIEIQATAVIDE